MYRCLSSIQFEKFFLLRKDFRFDLPISFGPLYERRFRTGSIDVDHDRKHIRCRPSCLLTYIVIHVKNFHYVNLSCFTLILNTLLGGCVNLSESPNLGMNEVFDETEDLLYFLIPLAGLLS